MRDNLLRVSLEDLISAAIRHRKILSHWSFSKISVPRLSPNRRTNRSIDGLDSRLIGTDWWITSTTVHQRSKRNPLVYHPPFCLFLSFDRRLPFFTRSLFHLFTSTACLISRSDRESPCVPFHSSHLYFRRSLILLKKNQNRIDRSFRHSMLANNTFNHHLDFIYREQEKFHFSFHSYIFIYRSNFNSSINFLFPLQLFSYTGRNQDQASKLESRRKRRIIRKNWNAFPS